MRLEGLDDVAVYVGSFWLKREEGSKDEYGSVYVLAHWGDLCPESERAPECREAARVILKEVLVELVVMELLNEIEERRTTLLLKHGIDMRVHGCKI